MVEQPTHCGLLEVVVLVVRRRAWIIGFPACPTCLVRLQLSTPIADVTETRTQIPQHEVNLMLQQDAWHSAGELQDGLALKETKAVTVQSASCDVFYTRSLK